MTMKRGLSMKVLSLMAYLVVQSRCEKNADYWTQFKVIYQKTYSDSAEEAFRFQLFNATCNLIDKHNAKYERGEETYFLRINQFADLTEAEFKQKYLTYKIIDGQHNLTFALPTGAVVPDSIDWRTEGAVTPVSEQGRCGSSHVFSAIGALEGQNYIKYNISLALSQQEVLDCAKEHHGCKGGSVKHVFDYIKESGISFYSSYPYYEQKETCKKGQGSGIKIRGYAEVPGNEEALKQAIGTIGPISVGLNLEHLRYYGGGIFDNPECGKNIHHAALAVGYDTTCNTDFWIIKNSWGKTWGEFGYVRLSRNKNQQCGISLHNFYPILV